MTGPNSERGSKIDHVLSTCSNFFTSFAALLASGAVGVPALAGFIGTGQVEDDIRTLASFTAVCLALLLGLSLCGVLLCITFSGLFETADEKWLWVPKALVAAICMLFFALVLTFVDQALLLASGESLAQWLVVLEVPALVVGFSLTLVLLLSPLPFTIRVAEGKQIKYWHFLGLVVALVFALLLAVLALFSTLT